MTRRQGRFAKLAARLSLGAVAAVAVALALPTAGATPETDASDAITAAWDAAGGETSVLGAARGDVYPVGAGFAQDFAGGKIFFTPETGARSLYGAVLDKYESLGGPANSDLGFPNINEVPGLVSPDSRVATFSASDSPVIFWTPEHGAYVVRGAINAGWDKLGSSTGPLGVPVGDETYDGAVVTQKFSGGELSWSSQTQKFTTVPPELADQLADLQVPVDPTAAINRAWRAAGGAAGPLGAKRGDQYQVGNDGVGQDFEGGKVYFSPATGAAAVEGDIAAKYESLGGPVGSDLGFPVANEADGPVAGSRISRFAAADEPVIFFTPENGAFVVRSAMKAAWDKLDGASGALGVPVGDQSVEAEKISQRFSGGSVVFDQATNTFSTQPPNLAKSLAGLQIPGLNVTSAASSGSTTAGGHRLGWHWWWLWVALIAVALLAALVWTGQWLWQRRLTGDDSARASMRAGSNAEDTDADDQWSVPHSQGDATVRLPSRYGETPGAETVEADDSEMGWAGYGASGFDDEDADTAPTRIPTAAELGRGRHAAADAAQADGGHDAVPAEAHGHPMMHLPLDDPYQAPDGYPVKANVASGLYYTEDSELYDDTLAEIWFADEESAQRNGFIKAR